MTPEKEARHIIRSIRRHVRLLNRKWAEMNQRTNEWQARIDEILERMIVFHAAMDDLHGRLQDVEKEKSRWQPVGDIIVDNLQEEIDLTKVRVGYHYFIQDCNYIDMVYERFLASIVGVHPDGHIPSIFLMIP